MARPKKVVYDLAEKLRRIRDAGLESTSTEKWEDTQVHSPDSDSLQDRIRALLKLVRDPSKNKYEMIYLIMYDIADNRVRNHIAKYLLSKGCIRIQLSVYMARSHQKVFKEIKDTLGEVQQAYDNADSILLVPVQSSSISSMKIIGKDIQVESLIDPPNTLFY